MARRKKTRKIKSKAKRFSFGSAKSKKKKVAAQGESGPRIIGALKLVVIVCVFAGVVGGLYFAERYVRTVTGVGEKTGPLELAGVPTWVSDELKAKVRQVAGGEEFKLDEDTARIVAERLRSAVAWLDDVKVQVKHDRVVVEAGYRKPIALVKSGLLKFYVDDKLVVLDYLPLAGLPIVTVEGVLITRQPPAGEVFDRDEVAAAVDVLKLLRKMDEQVTPDRPLLDEIDTIDVSNFGGRESPQAAHIVLYTRDQTQIVWGAEVKMWHLHLEAKDEDKLATLYGFYEQNGTLLGIVKYIELRNPQTSIPEPIEKY